MNNGCLIIGFICFGEFAVGGREGLVKTVSSIYSKNIIINGDDFGGFGCLLRERGQQTSSYLPTSTRHTRVFLTLLPHNHLVFIIFDAGYY